MNRPLSYLFLSAAMICTPALAQEAAVPDAAPAEAAAPAVTPPAEATPAVPVEAAAEATPAEPEAAAAAVVQSEPEPAAPPPSATAALDPRVTPVPAGKAQIVFFRPWNYLGAAVSFTITEGGADVAKVTNGRYYVYVTDPGAHTFQVKSEATDALTLELDEGETYYVRQTMDMGVLLYRPNMAPSDAMSFASLPKLKLAKPPKSKTTT